MLGGILKERRQVRIRKRRRGFALHQSWSLQGCGGGSPEYDAPSKRRIQNLLIDSFIYSFFHPSSHPSFYFFLTLKMLLLTVLGLCCCAGFSLVMGLRRGGSSLVAMCGLLLRQSLG